MKMMKFFICLTAILGMVCLSSALDRPESFARRSKNRKLQISSMEVCTGELGNCMAIVGPSGIPYAQLGQILSTFGDSDTIVDLRVLIESLENVDFGDVADTVEELAAVGVEVNGAALDNLTGQTDEIMAYIEEGEIEENQVGFVIGIINGILNFLGPIIGKNFMPITSILSIIGRTVDVVLGIVTAIAGGPISIIIAVVTNIIPIITLIVDTLGLLFGSGAGPTATMTNNSTTTTNTTATITTAGTTNTTTPTIRECNVELARCSMDRLILSGLPALIGGAFLVEASKLAAEDDNEDHNA